MSLVESCLRKNEVLCSRCGVEFFRLLKIPRFTCDLSFPHTQILSFSFSLARPSNATMNENVSIEYGMASCLGPEYDYPIRRAKRTNAPQQLEIWKIKAKRLLEIEEMTLVPMAEKRKFFPQHIRKNLSLRKNSFFGRKNFSREGFFSVKNDYTPFRWRSWVSVLFGSRPRAVFSRLSRFPLVVGEHFARTGKNTLADRLLIEDARRDVLSRCGSAERDQVEHRVKCYMNPIEESEKGFRMDPHQVVESGSWTRLPEEVMKEEQIEADKVSERLKKRDMSKPPDMDDLFFENTDEATELFDKIWGREVKKRLWRLAKARDNKSHGALAFPVRQGDLQPPDFKKRKLRPCADFRGPNGQTTRSEAMHLRGLRALRELALRLGRHDENLHNLFWRSKRDVSADVTREISINDYMSEFERNVQEWKEHEFASQIAQKQLEDGSSRYIQCFLPLNFALDMSGWYYQFVCRQVAMDVVWCHVPKSRWHLIPEEFKVWCKKTGRLWVSLHAHVMCFGSVPSVYYACAISEAFAWSTAQGLSLLILLYIDDSLGSCRKELCLQASALYRLALLVTGKAISGDKTSNHHYQRCIRLLGMDFSWQDWLGGVTLFASAPLVKIAEFAKRVDEACLAISAGNLLQKEILSLRSVYAWLTQFRRLAVVFGGVLNKWSSDEHFFAVTIRKKSERRLLKAQLLLMKLIVKDNRPDIVDRRRCNKVILHSWSDACGELGWMQHQLKHSKGYVITKQDVVDAQIYCGGWANWFGEKVAYRSRIDDLPLWVKQGAAMGKWSISIALFELLGWLIMAKKTPDRVRREAVVVSHVDNLPIVFSVMRCCCSDLLVRVLMMCFYSWSETEPGKGGDQDGTSVVFDWYCAWIRGPRNYLADAATRRWQTILEYFPDTKITFSTSSQDRDADFWWSYAKQMLKIVEGLDPGGIQNPECKPPFPFGTTS